MKKIKNYRIEIQDAQTLSVPPIEGMTFKDQVLKCDILYGATCLWILIDDEQPAVDRNIITIKKDQDAGIVNPEYYLGTYQMLGAIYIGHLFWDGQ